MNQRRTGVTEIEETEWRSEGWDCWIGDGEEEGGGFDRLWRL